MNGIELVGLTAGCLTSVAAVPQVLKTMRTRDVAGLSLGQPLALSIGLILWLVYGACIGNLPIVVSNILPLLLNVALVRLKLVYGRTPAVVAAARAATPAGAPAGELG